MTVTPAAVKADPRDLTDRETFEKIAAYCERTMKVTRTYAERGVAECLVFMKAMADNPGVARISPSLAVDPFWHAWMLHSAQYQAFEEAHAGGRRLSHAPHSPADYTPEASEAALKHTIGLLDATGCAFDLEFWGGYATCGQGNSP
jgi:hypothetical protein